MGQFPFSIYILSSCLSSFSDGTLTSCALLFCMQWRLFAVRRPSRPSSTSGDDWIIRCWKCRLAGRYSTT